MQYLPWFKHSGKWNWRSLLDAEPYVYWYKASEAERMLGDAGFRIIAVGTDEHIAKNAMRETVHQLDSKWMRGHIYFVCTK